MARKQRVDPRNELARQEKIKRLAIMAIFSDDELFGRFALKGGTALGIVHQISYRSSIDIDLSMDGDFSAAERIFLQERIERTLHVTFLEAGYRVFDVRVFEQPSVVTPDLADFWRGYKVEFKVIESEKYSLLKEDIDALRRHAVRLGRGCIFEIEISKFEYTAEKVLELLDGIRVFAYSPEMIVCEKLRALCQQMPEYATVVKRTRPSSSRARDFVDIHFLICEKRIDLGSPSLVGLFRNVFAAKRVDPRLLRKLGSYREFHRTSFPAVVASALPGVSLLSFDSYVDFVLAEIRRLEPLGDE